mgnify:CR=1 FL=1
MLVQFKMKNVLSFKEETIFDMTAISAYKEHPSNLIDIDTKEKFLRVAAIYGANASGKSNFVWALQLFRRIVSQSLNNVDDGAESVLKKCSKPFSFEENKGNSEFEIVQILRDEEYQYGFEYNSEKIVMEWLYRKSLKTNRKVTIFERTMQKVNLGVSVRKKCEAYKDQIPPETLLLSFFNKLKLKTDIFKTVYSGITDVLVFMSDDYEDTRFLDALLPKVIDGKKEKLLEFLTAIDIGIKDITYKEKETLFFTFHKGADGELYPLNLYDESEGTIKSIMLFIHAHMAIINDYVLVMDELNVKLHPLLLKFFIDLFYDNNSMAQLIYTTHDTTLMDKKFFRRDQIWFVQKDELGHSELCALSDFKVRSDASFEKDYLAGVYGGIPFLKEFSLKEGE